MRFTGPFIPAVLAALAISSAASLAPGFARGAEAAGALQPVGDRVAPAPVAEEVQRAPVLPKAQMDVMIRSARAGWRYVTREVTAAGFVGATKSYPHLTVWDMGSLLASAYSARELGFINTAQYHRFAKRTLNSMEKLELYDNAAYNRMYAARNGALIDSKAEPSKVGMGWSALDHGRMLIWLRLVADRDAALAGDALRVVARMNLSRIVSNGYMQGEELTVGSERRWYQEGRIGYEQYAAEGFALWGVRVDSATTFARNGKPVVVNDQALLMDTRGGDVMTSEPFVMMGLELGWKTEEWRKLAMAVLAAQEERYKREGIVTMVSEDAIPVPPAYFYYYLVHQNGKPFVVTNVGGVASDTFPRWVSAKAAFGYHALVPSTYTWLAVETVRPGGNAEGWTSGVYEGTKKSTDQFNLNTAAIVLESAAYLKRGCAFIHRVCPRK